MMKFERIIPLIILTFWVLGHQTTAAMSEKRLALVIGNSAYSHAPNLANPRNDASDLAAALKRLNFEVIKGLDLNKTAMNATIRKFSKALKTADVALFYYAGHGLQVNGVNYLAPTDAKLTTIADLDFDTVSLSLVLRQMERKRRTNLVFLDACRDNPLAQTLARSLGSSRSVNLTRGLARVETGVGTMISYSTQPGNVALDGTGRNSPFTTALLKHIEKPGIDISELMISVRKDVLASSDGKQVPWENSSLTGQFYFNPSAPSSLSTTKPLAKRTSERITINTVDDNVLDLTFWNSIKTTLNPLEMEAYLKRFPQGVFAGLAKQKIEALRLSKARNKPPPQKLATLSPGEQQSPPPAGNTVDKQEPLPLDKEKLVFSMQRHLKRVGCYDGKLDGDWGRNSRIAMRRYNIATSQNLPIEEITQDTLNAVRKHKGQVCRRPVIAKQRPHTRRRHENRPSKTPRHKKKCRTVFPETQNWDEAPWTRVCD